MKKPLRKLIAFSTALAAMMSGTVLNSAAVYVSEQVEDCDYDTLIQMRDKDILIKDGNSENISDDTKLVIIDENGEKKLVDKSLGINGIYSYVSTTMGRYNYISPTNPGYSFDFFDESYRISTEADEFIVGVGDKFALMNNDQEIISDEYNNIYRINEDYFIIDDSVNPEYHGEYWDDGLDKYDENKSGLMKADGTVIVPTTDGIMGFYLTADGKNFLVKSENGDYFMDLDGNAVTGTYSDITELRHAGSGDSDDDHFNVDKYRANYLLCDYGFKAEDENGKYTVLDKSFSVVLENVVNCDYSFTSEQKINYEFETDEYTYVYDEDFSLSRQIPKVDYDCSFNTGYAKLNDGVVTVWSKDYSKTNTIDLGFSKDELNNVYIDIYSYWSENYDFEIALNYYDTNLEEWVYKNYYYLVSSNLEILEVTAYSYYNKLSDNSIAVRKSEDSPMQIIDFSGNVIYTASEGMNNIETKDVWDSEADKFQITNYYISSDSAFTILDSDFNPIWENVPGTYHYNWVPNYNVTVEDENGSSKSLYGAFDMEKGVVIKPEYDSVKQIGGGYFAVKDEILYAFDADGNLKNQWNDTYEYDTTTHSSYITVDSLGDKYFAVIDGNSVIIDPDMNIIQEWDGIYKFESGTYSAYTVDHTFNKRENGVTSTIVYNSETDAIDYQQEGQYDHVSFCLAGYMVVTNYGNSDDLWSGNNSKGIIKLDGTEVISPINNLYIFMSIDYDLVKETKIVNEDEIRFTLHGEGETNSNNYYWWCYLKPAEIQYEFAHEYGYAFAYKTEVGTFVTAEKNTIMIEQLLFGMADEDGNVLLENDYRYPFEFYDGLALATSFREEVYEDHECFHSNSEGYIESHYDEKNGIVDVYGRVIVQPFSNLTISKKIDPNCHSYGYRRTGILFCEEDNTFHVKKLLEDGTFALKDYKGSEVINDFALNYGYDVAKAEGDLYYVEKDGLAGIVTNKNEVLVPVQYEAVLSFNSCSHSLRYVRKNLIEILSNEFTSKLRKLSDGSMLVNVKDNNGKIGVYKIYDDGSKPPVTTTTTTTSSVTTTTTTTTTTTASDKKPLTTTTTVTVKTPVTTTTANENNKKVNLGDVNINGSVDALDASIILTEYALIATGHDSSLNAEQKKAADLNKDGAVDALDASLVLSYYAYTATGGKLSVEDYIK